MPRFSFGIFIGPGATLGPFVLSLPSTFNPSGDWGSMYILAHPRNPGAMLVTSGHGKVLLTSGVWGYRFSVTNISVTLAAIFDVDTT
jgi:hypothetical protein